ncbi:MAG: cupredoxin domain-containing protein [Actinomycetota bacterium]
MRYGWIWWSIGLLVLVTVAMYAMARPHFARIRFITDAMVGGSHAVGDREYGEALSAPRALAIAAIGFVGLAPILYLMLFKPSPGMEPEAAAAPPGPPAVTLAATETTFDFGSLTVPAGREFGLALQNRSSVPHNLSIRSAGEVLFTGETFTGPRTVTYGVPALEAGDYTFVCDLHPPADDRRSLRNPFLRGRRGPAPGSPTGGCQPGGQS